MLFASARVHSRFNFALLNKLKGVDACPAYSLQHVVKHLHLQSCVEKYESYKSQLFC
jgi:hypothetical protein